MAKFKKEKRRFPAVSGDGRQFTIIEIGNYVSGETLSGDDDEPIETITEFRTDDGKHVNQDKGGSYYVVELGLHVTPSLR